MKSEIMSFNCTDCNFSVKKEDFIADYIWQKVINDHKEVHEKEKEKQKICFECGGAKYVTRPCCYTCKKCGKVIDYD